MQPTNYLVFAIRVEHRKAQLQHLSLQILHRMMVLQMVRQHRVKARTRRLDPIQSTHPALVRFAYPKYLIRNEIWLFDVIWNNVTEISCIFLLFRYLMDNGTQRRIRNTMSSFKDGCYSHSLYQFSFLKVVSFYGSSAYISPEIRMKGKLVVYTIVLS